MMIVSLISLFDHLYFISSNFSRPFVNQISKNDRDQHDKDDARSDDYRIKLAVNNMVVEQYFDNNNAGAEAHREPNPSQYSLFSAQFLSSHQINAQ